MEPAVDSCRRGAGCMSGALPSFRHNKPLHPTSHVLSYELQFASSGCGGNEHGKKKFRMHNYLTKSKKGGWFLGYRESS